MVEDNRWRPTEDNIGKSSFSWSSGAWTQEGPVQAHRTLCGMFWQGYYQFVALQAKINRPDCMYVHKLMAQFSGLAIL